ncbi:MAG: LLM class flavin-dependent oxidoreductase [Actinomycetota bacterium]|nr:LLM class flavin-dependent oxidoreductase [Actinomycetota bacterium]
MNETLFGVTLPQFGSDPEVFVEGARRAEALGFDSIWVFDHLWPLSGGKQRPIFEAWTSMAFLAAETRSAHIGTLVTRSSLRHPVVLAKTIATTAAIAPDRVIVGIGSGDDLSRAENEAFGLPHWEADKRIEQLISTVELVRGFLTVGELSQHDAYAAVSSLPASPSPVGGVPLWIAGRSDDALEAAGVVADGWNGWGGTPKSFARDAATVVEHAQGRSVELTWAGQVAIGADDDEVNAKMAGRNPRHFIAGTPEQVAERLARFIDAGARHIICTAPDSSDPAVFELLARARERL